MNNKEENCECGLTEDNTWSDEIFDRYGCDCEDDGIDLGLLIAVVNQIELDVENKDYTCIEQLFKYLDDPEYRLKGFLRDE